MEGGLGRIMRYTTESARRSLLEPVAAKLDAEESKVREGKERREEMRFTYMKQVKEDVARTAPKRPLLDPAHAPRRQLPRPRRGRKSTDCATWSGGGRPACGRKSNAHATRSKRKGLWRKSTAHTPQRGPFLPERGRKSTARATWLG